MDKIQVFPTEEALYQGAAERWTLAAREAIRQTGAFHVALSGGSTPKSLYQLLASDPYASQIDWGRVHVYFGDERCVPMDHPESNYRMAREALLDAVPISSGQVFRIRTELSDPKLIAADYGQTLQSRLPKDNRLDLILLGVGTDGHTASLFPGTSILAVRDRLAAAVYVEKLSAWRISMTYPAIEQARQVLFLVSGAAKAPIVASVLSAPESDTLPVQGLRAAGEVSWYLDRAAAHEWEAGK